jgi:poly-gamma-glutamate synthesis protein (capsule biosynthesis protein)
MTRTTFNRRHLIAGSAATAASLPLGLRTPVVATGGRHALAAMQAQGLPGATGLATSVRLPLYGIGSTQIRGLLDGTITDWREVGAPVSLPVKAIGIDGVDAAGMTFAETVADYAGFVDKTREEPGAIAIVPLDQVTIDVGILAIDGDSPLITAGTETAPMTRIGFGGDILFGRNVGNRMRQYEDYTFPMLALKDLFASFDLTIANWECFVSTTIDPPELTDPNTLDFITVPDAIEGVIMSGIDAVSMANNHAFFSVAGHGPEAWRDTVGFLDEAGLPWFGAGENLDQAREAFTTEVNGLRIAILGVDGVTANIDFSGPWGSDQTSASEDGPGTNPLVMANLEEDITRLAEENDIVIPFFHMGQEYLWNPREFAVDVTRACIDYGASAVITSHPHTIMGMDVYKGKPIFHAIGNLVYDQMFAVDTRTGYIAELTFKGKDVVGFRVHGFENFDFCQARLMSQGENAALLNRFWRSTDMTQQYYPAE